MAIKVSVIMPSLNVAAYIRECIESVIHQTMQDIEMICVDAGSNDGTRQILEEYAEKDARITVLNSDVKSYGRQVNMGISAAKGRYVAILETDDFILNDMYEKLFLLAEEQCLDFVMADFRHFYDDENVERVYYNAEVFKDTPEIYNKVLTLRDHARIYNSGDVTLWRGIFLKEFLISNNIRLNETPGAAYQDICFMHRVRMKAKRSMYANEYGYCYRTDRQGSSVNSVKGLQYAKYEYQYLLENEEIPDAYMGKIYYLMASSLLGECLHILPKTGCVWKKEDAECYEWFHRILVKAIQENKLKKSMGAESWWRQLEVILNSKEDFALRIKKVSDNFEQMKHIAASTSAMVVCGAGLRGKSLIELLKNSGIVREDKCILYADNNNQLWHNRVNGIEIVSVDECAIRYPNADFVIANKLHGEEIKAQLMSEGIGKENIYEYIPAVDWD